MGSAKSYLAVFENVRAPQGNHMVIDLTEEAAMLLARNPAVRKTWEASRTPSGHHLTMIIPKETPGADPVALWRR